MSVIDILTRVDSICKKYDRYDIDKHNKDSNLLSGDDAFARLYATIDADIETTLQKADTASNEKNRASAVAINAEIRRTKARLIQEVPKLQKLALKKVKGLSSEEFAARNDLVLALPDRINAIPDGAAAAPKQSGGWGGSGSRAEIKFDSGDYKLHPFQKSFHCRRINYPLQCYTTPFIMMICCLSFLSIFGMDTHGRFDDEYFQQTEESSQFRQEYEMRKIRQDQGLEVISEGLDTLKNMASDMNEVCLLFVELDKHVPLMDEIDTKIDQAASDLKNTNVRLKDTVNQLRSSRNFCIDIILLCIILGIAAYLYNVLKK